MFQAVSAVKANVTFGSNGPIPSYPPASVKLVPKYQGPTIARQDALQFFSPPTNDHNLSLQRDIFMWAFRAFQSTDHYNPWGFYQIAGIHGIPHLPFDGDDSTEWINAFLKDPSETIANWWGGYCHHGDVLFPTWHRPYMLILEQAIIYWAVQVVENPPLPPSGPAIDPNLLLKIANNIRVPYLDWAGDYVSKNGLPKIFTDDTVEVNWPSKTSIPNPLRGFTAPIDIGTPVSSGANFNPPAKPYYRVPILNDSIYTPQGYSTVRYPDNKYITQTAKIQETLLKDSGTKLRELLQIVFDIRQWVPFSNHTYQLAHSDKPDAPPPPPTSLEGVHDQVHIILGGPGGHMGDPNFAGFDPIFFFHHCNVDRLLALWQFAYDTYNFNKSVGSGGSGGAWLPSSLGSDKDLSNPDGTFYEEVGSQLDEKTELRPFRKLDTNSQGWSWFTSADVHSVEWDLNYTYPDLELARKNNWTQAQFLEHVRQLYIPLCSTARVWFLNLVNIQKLQFEGPYTIRIFIDKQDANVNTPTTDIHYAGEVFIFARSGKIKCANCIKYNKIRGIINITQTLLYLQKLNSETVRTAIKLKLPANAFKVVFVAFDGKTELFAPDDGKPEIKLFSLPNIIHPATANTHAQSKYIAPDTTQIHPETGGTFIL